MEALTALIPGIPPLVWWLLATGMVLTGLAGTVLPVLPGTLLVLGGLFVGAWIDGFAKVGGGSLAVIAVLAVLAWATDYVAALLGAKKVGASRWALIGAALGTVIGVFMGLVGVLFMPFVGAVAGELYARREQAATAGGLMAREATQQALKVGTATWIGMLVGTAIKIALVFLMIGVFVAALLVK